MKVDLPIGKPNQWRAPRGFKLLGKPLGLMNGMRSINRLSLPISKPAAWPDAATWKLPDRRFRLLLAAALISLVAGYVGYQRFLAATQSTVAVQTTPARIGSLVTTVSATGSIVDSRQAKLSFPVSGTLSEMDVNVGDSVKAGQTLAKLDPAPLQFKEEAAQSVLDTAKIKLQQLKDGATPEERSAAQAAYNAAVAKLNDVAAGATAADRQAAQSSVTQAQATLNAAQAKLDQVKAGPTDADKTAAQSAVDQAKASLNAAQVKLDQVKNNTYTAADMTAAQAAVDSDKAALATAQAKLDQLQHPTGADLAAAQSAVDQAKASLTSAEDRYQMTQNGNLKDSGASSNSAAQQDYDAAQANYDAAVQKLQQLQSPPAADLQAAQSTVTQAQASLNASQAKLDLMKQGPQPTDLASAQAAVDQAQATLNSAQAKLDQVNAGPVDADVASAQSAVDQANASLAAAQAKLNQVNAGPTASDLQSAKSGVAGAQADLSTKTSPPKDTDVGLAQEQVNQAQLSLDQAQLDLAHATLTAPFDGVVAALGPNVGEQVGSTAVVTLVDPKSVRIDATVDESDVAKLAVGQPATVTFDAIPNYQVQGKVISIAPAGTTTQGVVSYLASVGITNPDRPLPAGMSASLSVETSRKDNVLLVPNRAVQTQRGSKTVQVIAGGKTEVRTVQTGDSNDQMTEIVSGLKQGDQVVIPGTSTAQPRTANFQMGGALGGGGNFRPGGR